MHQECITTYQHDDMGRVYQVTSPDTGTTTYGYDPAGNLVQKVDAKGVTVGYQYDALNRLTKIDFGSDTDVVYVYDSCLNGKGRLCGTTDQAGTASYEYSAKGELVKETKVIQGRTYVTSYQFDKNGNLQQIAYPSGRKVTYALDAADRATGVTTTPAGGSAQTLASSIAHKPFGGIASMTYGNGLARTVGYDQQYRIASIVTGAVQNVSYTHDPNGNITGITDAINPTKNKTFSYDALDRLTGGTGPWGSLSWTYDPVGNRQAQVENGATSTYSYQSGTNKLSGVAGASPLSFTLDANGNTTAENTKTYTFNQNNRLIKASESATLGEYTFNANGQRATKTAGGTTTVFHHDQTGNLIAETTSAGVTVAEYIHLDGQPLAKVDSGGTRFVHPDHLGTPQIMTGPTKAIVWQIESKPFGDGASITGTASLNLRFPGQYYDSETGLHQNWFRDYMPRVGRYVEADPLGTQRGHVGLYAYAEGNSIRFIDVEGLLSFDEVRRLVAENNLSMQANSLIICMAWKESSFDPYGTPSGDPPSTARGLLQVTKGAAQDVGYNHQQLFDPEMNIQAGSEYLRLRIRRARGDVKKGLEGYGTGPGYADNLFECERCLRENPCTPQKCLTRIHR